MLQGLIKCLTVPTFLAICRRILCDFSAFRSGFPDIFLWNPYESTVSVVWSRHKQSRSRVVPNASACIPYAELVRGSEGPQGRAFPAPGQMARIPPPERRSSGHCGRSHEMKSGRTSLRTSRDPHARDNGTNFCEVLMERIFIAVQ